MLGKQRFREDGLKSVAPATDTPIDEAFGITLLERSTDAVLHQYSRMTNSNRNTVVKLLHLQEESLGLPTVENGRSVSAYVFVPAISQPHLR